MPSEPLKPTKVEHVGIIMDGNGRWATSRGLPRSKGHLQGTKVARSIIQAAPSLGIKILTIFAFSTENWNRPNLEIDTLMKLFSREITKQFERLKNDKIKVIFIGSKFGLSEYTIKKMKKLENETKYNSRLTLQIAFNYGGRQDIVESFKKLSTKILDGKLSPEEITESHISNELSTKQTSDPDLIIRTSGEMRLSNFLLWQSAYSELAFINKLWPDFTPEDLTKIIDQVSTRNRRFGSIKEIES